MALSQRKSGHCSRKIYNRNRDAWSLRKRGEEDSIEAVDYLQKLAFSSEKI